MTFELAKQFFCGFERDPVLFEDPALMKPYIYNEQQVEVYVQKQKNSNRIHLAIMLDTEPIGEIILKDVDREKKQCTLSIHLKNDRFKNQGFGTAAEIQALEYAFEKMDMEIVCADALRLNVRSQRVLEKAGFQKTSSDGRFVYFECRRNGWSSSK